MFSFATQTTEVDKKLSLKYCSSKILLTRQLLLSLISIAFETCHLCKRFFLIKSSLSNIHKEIGKTERVVMFNFNFLLFSLRCIIDLTVALLDVHELVTLLIVRSKLMRINAWTRDKLFFYDTLFRLYDLTLKTHSIHAHRTRLQGIKNPIY